MSFLRKIVDLLDKKNRRRIWFILLGMLFSSFLEGVGLSGIPLYINTIFNNGSGVGEVGQYIDRFKEWSGGNFVLLFSLLIFLFYLFKNGVYYILKYLTYLFILKYKTTLETTLLNKFIVTPYLSQISNNSSYYINTIRDADLFINKVLLPFVNSIMDFLIIVSIVVVLVFQLPVSLIFLLVAVVAVSFLLISFLRKKMKVLGGREIKYRQHVIKVLNETFMLNKEIHVFQNYGFFSKRFHSIANDLNRTFFYHGRLNNGIKPLMEIVSILILVVIVLYFVWHPQESMMGILALLAVALVKMLPSLQTLTTSINSIQYQLPVMNNIHAILKEDKQEFDEMNEKISASSSIHFDKVAFDQVSFNYTDKSAAALKDVNVTIKKNDVVGIIGTSGAGKSTFIDLILGLMNSTHGNILIDAKPLREVVYNWRSNIGYVPQNLNLLDDTVKNNILFGRDYDAERFEYALKYSGVSSFFNVLENGVETQVGERGIKVSGGQKQRIGIARALYNKPELLIFDEATSSLDMESEELITDTIRALKNQITVLIISHRYPVLKYCDFILELEKGQVKKSYTYQELVN